MKNEELLKQWENVVQKQNMLPFKVTNSSRICSAHFEKADYIIPVSTSDSCRLKSHAVASLFACHEFIEEPPTVSRLEMLSTQPLSSIDYTMSLPAKTAKIESYREDEQDELESYDKKLNHYNRNYDEQSKKFET